jgi:hypothetical protein
MLVLSCVVPDVATSSARLIPDTIVRTAVAPNKAFIIVNLHGQIAERGQLADIKVNGQRLDWFGVQKKREFRHGRVAIVRQSGRASSTMEDDYRATCVLLDGIRGLVER